MPGMPQGEIEDRTTTVRCRSSLRRPRRIDVVFSAHLLDSDPESLSLYMRCHRTRSAWNTLDVTFKALSFGSNTLRRI